MLLNPRYLPLLLQNWSEVNRCAHRLNSSLARLQADFPLTGERLAADDESLFERLDAFRVRYADLQDAIGNKLFRSILLVLVHIPAHREQPFRLNVNTYSAPT